MKNLSKDNMDYLYIGLAEMLMSGISIGDMVNRSSEEIKGFLAHNHPNLRSASDTNQRIKTEAFWTELKKKSELIDGWDFFWIDDERATYFVWNFIKNLYVNNTDGSSISCYQLPNFFPVNSHQERVVVIRKFLILNHNLVDIVTLIQYIKQIWSRVLQQNTELKLLKDMEPELVKWLFDRVVSKPFKGINLSYYQIAVVNGNFQLNRCPNYLLNPQCSLHNQEIKLSIQAILDINADWNKIEFPIYSKTLIETQNDIIKEEISRCYTQKLYQFKKKQLKSFNTHLDQKSFEQFKKLQKHYGLNKEDMLMYLISEAARKVK